jgi:anthranilate phosphoribosyltransferase
MGDAAPQDLGWAIKKVVAGESLTQTESAQAFELIMSGGATDAQLGALLLGMHVRG